MRYSRHWNTGAHTIYRHRFIHRTLSVFDRRTRPLKQLQFELRTFHTDACVLLCTRSVHLMLWSRLVFKESKSHALLFCRRSHKGNTRAIVLDWAIIVEHQAPSQLFLCSLYSGLWINFVRISKNNK